MRPRLALCVFSLALGLLAITPRALSQGCVPAHYMSLSLGAQGIMYLAPGQWEGDLSYRFLHSETDFSGPHEQPQAHAFGGRNWVHSVDTTATYALSSRYSLSLTVPLEHDDFSLVQGDGLRHGGSSDGLGDVRLVANAWLLPPDQHPQGNIALGLGVKAPTGDDRVLTDWHNKDGSISRRPADIAAQLGDGGVGAVLEMQAFEKLVQNLYAYASGLYLINPRNVNGTETAPPMSPAVVNSVPDQYFGRAGLSYVVWPSKGLAMSLGGRIDGIPVHDVIGGSDGFRRAGYSFYVDPGINWSFGRNNLSLNVPVAVQRDLAVTKYSKLGGFADYIVVASYSRQF